MQGNSMDISIGLDEEESMGANTRYRANFSDDTTTHSIWIDRPFTHAWRWVGKTHDGRTVSGSGFSGSETLARKQLKSETSFLTKRPRMSKYDPQESLDWKPGGQVLSEEIVSCEILEKQM